MKRVIQRDLQDPLALRLLKGDFVPGDTIEVSVGRDELALAKRARA